MPEATPRTNRPLSHAERGRLGGEHRHRLSPEETAENKRRAALAAAAAKVVDRAPELTPEQITRLRAVLSPALAQVRAKRALDVA